MVSPPRDLERQPRTPVIVIAVPRVFALIGPAEPVVVEEESWQAKRQRERKREREREREVEVEEGREMKGKQEEQT